MVDQGLLSYDINHLHQLIAQIGGIASQTHDNHGTSVSLLNTVIADDHFIGVQQDAFSQKMVPMNNNYQDCANTLQQMGGALQQCLDAILQCDSQCASNLGG